MTAKKKNIITSVLFLAFGAFVFYEASGIKHVMKNDVGSAFFPQIIAGAMIVVALIRLVMALREEEKEAKASDSDLKGGWETILLLCAYVLAFQPVGFILDTVVFLFLEMLVLTPKEKRSLPLLGILSVATPLVIYTLFVYVINTPLPKGLFGF